MNPLLVLLLQIAVIIVFSRAVGWVFRLLHQPQVVGEMAAGIMLGPSLLGWVAPDVSGALFPLESLGYLNTLSQVGLIVFMFLVGLELEPRLLRGRGKTAIVTSHASIVVPFCLGSGLALYLYPRLSDDSVAFTSFALFMGAAMSVTAFPVLARILTERNLLSTRLGAVTIACAAVDDISAWSILAVVVALVRASAAHTSPWFTLCGSACYLALMLAVVRPALRWLESYYHTRGRLTQDMIGIVLLLVLASAWTTEWLGIHALFGAFALGAVMPKDAGLVHDLMEKLEDLTVVLLLPIFFAFTGLRTSIGLVQGAEMWSYFGFVLLIACAGKFGGSAIAARLTGLGWREAGAVGILMNTRGLMELVILGIGLDLGAISPALFAIMVMMALATTAMTTPILELIYPARRFEEDRLAVEDTSGAYTVLIPISLPSAGPGLLEAALRLAPRGRPLQIYAAHLQRSSDLSYTRSRLPGDEGALQPLLARAAERGVEVRPLSFTSTNIARDIRDLARVKRADLVVMGWHKPILRQGVLSGTVLSVMEECTAEVAVFVERNAPPWHKILVPFRDMTTDRAALGVAARLASEPGIDATILHVVADRDARVANSETAFPDGVRLEVVDSNDPVEAAVREAREGYDLIVVGVAREWGTAPAFPFIFGQRHEALARNSTASLLIVRPKSAEPTAAPANRRSAA
jgi:Kef-type K+ transport system membrane component KefB/nucleotide-binding universal stress UspA family protein